MAAAISFLTGRPLPFADTRTLDVSWATLSEALAVTGTPPDTPSLSIRNVALAFDEVATASGPGSKRAKVQRLTALLSRATDEERSVIRSILLGEMRIGLHEGLLQEAVAQAAGADLDLVRRAAHFLADLAEVARIALTEGPAGLQRVNVRLFAPLLPMLAETATALGDAFDAHRGRTALEVKYDGARIQLHQQGDRVRIWSRGMAEVTESLPDVAAIPRRVFRGDGFILDGEVVAVGPDGRPLPFQDLMRRFRRVRAIEAAAAEIPLALYLFDCLMLDERSLIDEPYERRWAALARLTGGAHLAHRIIPRDVRDAETFLSEALAAGHEGVMVKALDSPYTPGSRGKRWLKVKPADTIDCVIVAADWGSGRRRGWLSNYHLAVADGAAAHDAAGWAPVGKTFKGLTDEEFRAMTARLQALAIRDDGYTVTVRPEVVVEVAYNEIQRSPHYSSKFALRFARITRIRDDKGPQHATSLAELRALYERQFASKSRRAR